MQVLINNINFKEYIRFYLLNKLVRLAEYFYFVIPNYFKIRKIKKFKNTKIGRFAFVIAGGPSVRKLDANKLLAYKKSGFDVFAGNSYINTHLGQIVMPDYYFFSDDKFFKSNSGVPNEDNFSVVNTLEVLGIPSFFPHRYAKICRNKKNSYIFNDTIDLFCNNVADLTKPRPYTSMTLYKALSLACYMGYSKIYISGFDNDYFKNYQCNEENEIFYEDRHFYSFENGEDIIRKVDKEVHKSMSALLLHISTLFSGLEKFTAYPIINLDKNSLVDAFSKKHDIDVYKN